MKRKFQYNLRMLRRFALALISSLALTVPLTSIAKAEEVEVDAGTSPVTLPDIGIISEVGKGDVIAVGFDAETAKSGDVAVLKERLARRTKDRWLHIPKGTALLPNDDGWYCTAERTSPAVSQYPHAVICLKDRDGDGVFEVTGGVFGANLSRVSVSYDIQPRDIELVPSSSFRRALLFGGFDNERVSLTYIEYDNDPANPSKRLDGSVAYDSKARSFQFGDVLFEAREISSKKVVVTRVSGDL